ncbi:MAG: hypothetical protein K6G26_12115 [Lachnospiraceae bacterium]|nr:hypothetical protein [Lachnospiraceae bacterium]
MSKKKLFTKKSIIGLTLAALVAVGAGYGIYTKSAQSKASNFNEVYATGLEAPSMEDEAWFNENAVVINNAEDYYDLTEDGELDEVYNDEDVKEKQEKDAELDTTLSSSVDNSKSKYFPPVLTQGSVGSCCSFANVYYQFTYTYNKQHDIESKGDENVFSPMWSFTQCSMNPQPIAKLLIEKGAVHVSDIPINTDQDLYDDGTYPRLNVYGTEAIQTEAINHRIGGIYTIPNILGSDILSPDDEQLIPIKTALDNGELLTFSTDVYAYSYNYKIDYNSSDDIYKGTSNKKYKGDIICARCDNKTGGSHRMTLVGYDDNIWVDINKNGEKEIGEMGAFKIANSWGTGWGNKGFLWVSYDAMNLLSSVSENSAITLSPSKAYPFSEIMGYIPTNVTTNQYIQFDISSNEILVNPDNSSLCASNGQDDYSYTMYNFENVGSKLSNGKYTATLVYPLNNVIADVNSSNLKNYEWKMRVDFNSLETDVTISNVKIVDKETKKQYRDKLKADTIFTNEIKDIDINLVDVSSGDETVIYYAGYSNPYIHYCVDGGNWTNVPGIAMEKTSEMSGFTHKAVIELNKADGVTVCFNDGNNNWDSANGNNYRFEKGVYTYKQGNITKISEGTTTDKFDAVLKTNKYGVLKVGENITLSAKAYGTNDSAMYRFGYIDKAQGTETIIADYSANDNASVTFNTSGLYHLFADVKDNNGNQIRKYIYNFDVEQPVISYISCDLSTPQRKGKNITFNADVRYVPVNGEVVAIAIDSNGNEEVIGTVKNSSVTWKPNKLDTYTIVIRVIKDNKVLAENTYWSKFKIITDDLTFMINDFSFSSDDLVMQDYTYLHADINSEKSYTIELGYINENGDKVALYNGSNNYAPTVTMPYASGNITFYLKATDESGATAYKEKQYTVHKFTIDDITVNPSGKIYEGETVTFTTKTSYERSYRFPNTRYFKITNKATNEVENLSNYYDDVTWTPAKAGKYTIECTINSYKTGSDTYTFDYEVYKKVNNDLYIDSVVPSIASPAKVGDSIYFDVNRVNETVNDSNYITYSIVNTDTNETGEYRENIYTDTERMIWTPDKAGNYKINITFVAGDKTADYTLDYVVKELPANNTVTIYYKGFSTPYMHYNVNGNWTNVPGIAMTPSTEVTGYTHKAVIELPEGTSSLTACFNDGNNNWDSNNGRNYTFSLGEYTYSNGTIKRLGVENTSTTIYYSGYSNPYIHYCINGNWTNVPGVNMEKTSELSGYTHKITIDMNDASSLTACFNDGYNNWDSNNGANYTFGIGTYCYKNGKITTK